MTADTVGSDANKQPAAKTQLTAIFGAGVIGGVDAIGFAVASATLFFAGNLSSGVGMAAGVCLLSSFIVCVCVAWRSEIRSNVAQIQDMGVAVLTGTLATTAAQMQAGDDSRVATAFAILSSSGDVTAGAGAYVDCTRYYVLGGRGAGTLRWMCPGTGPVRTEAHTCSPEVGSLTVTDLLRAELEATVP